MLRNKREATAMKGSPRSLQLEKARMQQRRPNTAKKKKNPTGLNYNASSIETALYFGQVT